MLSFRYLGGSQSDIANGTALDPYDNLLVSGETNSPDFPTKNPFDSSLGGQQDTFIYKLGSNRPITGKGLVYLPILRTPEAPHRGIYGYVTYTGCAAPNVTVDLRFYDGSAWSTLASAAQVRLPATFQWTKRWTAATDSYELNLLDPQDGRPWWWTYPPLGYVDSYTLTSLPRSFLKRTWYAWFVGVYGPDGGYGYSYWARWVAFLNTGGLLLPDAFSLPPVHWKDPSFLEKLFEGR